VSSPTTGNTGKESQNTELVLVSKSETIIKRFRAVNEEFKMEFAAFADPDALNAAENQVKGAKCFVIDCIEDKIGTVAGVVQSVKYISNTAYIVVIVGAKVDTDLLDIIKNLVPLLLF